MEIHESLTAGSKKRRTLGWVVFLRHAAFFLDPLSSPNLRLKGGSIEIAVQFFLGFQQQQHLKGFPGAPWFFFVRPFQQPFVEGKVQFAARQLCNPSWSPRRANPHPRQRKIKNSGKLFQKQITLPRDVHSPSMVPTICKPL